MVAGPLQMGISSIAAMAGAIPLAQG